MEVFLVSAQVDYEGSTGVGVADSFELAKRIAVDHAAEQVFEFDPCPATPILEDLPVVVLSEWQARHIDESTQTAYWESWCGSGVYDSYLIERWTVQHDETQGSAGA